MNVKDISITRLHDYENNPRNNDLAVEKELNMEYSGGFKHNKHKGLMNALIMKVAKRYDE